MERSKKYGEFGIPDGGNALLYIKHRCDQSACLEAKVFFTFADLLMDDWIALDNGGGSLLGPAVPPQVNLGMYMIPTALLRPPEHVC